MNFNFNIIYALIFIAASVICISSDEEESQISTKKNQETINISSDSSSDDVILLEKNEDIDVDMNNRFFSYIHTLLNSKYFEFVFNLT